MSLDQLRNANFGKTKSNLTGSSGVGYTLYNNDGSINSARTTTGVYQTVSGSGIYNAYISFPDSFRGHIFWDTGESIDNIAYATEQYNYEENNPKTDQIYTELLLVSGSVDFIKQIEGGRWKIDSNKMYFYKDDNTTLIATFDLFDQYGTPTDSDVMERQRL